MKNAKSTPVPVEQLKFLSLHELLAQFEVISKSAPKRTQ